MPLPEGLDKLLPAKVIEKAYEDAASPAAKEAGKVAVDLVKTARLLLAPFQLAEAFQDRFERVVERIRARVPEERQTAPPWRGQTQRACTMFYFFFAAPCLESR